jgi:hypothetical protein
MRLFLFVRPTGLHAARLLLLEVLNFHIEHSRDNKHGSLSEVVNE